MDLVPSLRSSMSFSAWSSEYCQLCLKNRCVDIEQSLIKAEFVHSFCHDLADLYVLGGGISRCLDKHFLILF